MTEKNKFSNVSEIDKKLHKAILKGDMDSFLELVDLGADINSCDNKGKTALYNACSTGNYELVQELIEMKVEMNDNFSSCSALEATNNDEIIDLLFSAGALRELEWYSKYRYSAHYEMVYSFVDKFRDEAIIKTIEYYNIDLNNLAVDLNDHEITDDLLYDLSLIGVKSIKNGEIEIDYNIDICERYSLNELFGKLGYEVEYEGIDGGKFIGKPGVYFVK